MTSQFAQSVLTELNKFRASPRSIQHQCEVIRKGFSRIKAGDPFLNEIDYFVKELDTMDQLPQLEFNEVLSEAAKRELPSFRGKKGYQKYKRSNSIKGIVPEYYLVASPALAADEGADDPINVLTKILLDKQDRLKEGRDILCDSKFTQIGIAHEIFDNENMVIMIFATEYVSDEPKFEIPFGNISELKKAFDILDEDGKEILKMNEIMETLNTMEFNKTDPTLYNIFKELSNRDKCSWPKFAYYANVRMTDRGTEEGLLTIFNLFIDDPKKKTINFETFKKICNEIECGFSEKQIKSIMENSTKNGDEIDFEEFVEYMKIFPESQ
jgi:Ca2+-binding EF-hand superfamily protein